MRIAAMEWILNLPKDHDTRKVYTTPLTMADGHAWVELVPQSESMQLQVRPKRTANGLLHEVEAQGSVNLVDDALTETLEEASRLRIAVLVYDNNGTSYLIGYEHHGAELNYETNVNPDPEGKTGYEITLQMEAENPIRIYKPS